MKHARQEAEAELMGLASMDGCQMDLAMELLHKAVAAAVQSTTSTGPGNTPGNGTGAGGNNACNNNDASCGGDLEGCRHVVVLLQDRFPSASHLVALPFLQQLLKMHETTKVSEGGLLFL